MQQIWSRFDTFSNAGSEIDDNGKRSNVASSVENYL